MAAQKILLPDFLRRLRREGPGIPLTWLIGAGMSATSGIPLAKQVSLRLILFEYLGENGDYRPWDPTLRRPLQYTERDLKDFFTWYDDPEFEAELAKLTQASIQWLQSQKEFKDVTPEDPDCYQLLFSHFHLNTTTHHQFLTRLVNLAKGVNLAHLGLAGLLRDHHKEWGHTVFTTNFDDLLMRAILSLEHTARVFGDVDSSDTPSLKPDYPQIVHLHGRHTGYRLLNTHEQIQLIDPEMKEGFKKHIADSHLVVLGYSGWDDLVMRTLNDWPEKQTLLRGSLFWVPYQSEETILPKAKEFLDRCPPGRAYIIENEDKTLDADGFMLQLCRTIHGEDGGFEPYREQILSFAMAQHTFTWRQLESHPDFDPRRALRLAREGREALTKKGEEEARKPLNEARKLIEDVRDIPDQLRGEVVQELALAEMLLGNLDMALRWAEEAVPIWDRIKSEDSAALLGKAESLRLLGEVYFLKGEIASAQTRLQQAFVRFENERVKSAYGIAVTAKLLADLALRKGQVPKAKMLLEKSLSSYQKVGDRYGTADCLKSMGTLFLVEGEFSRSIQRYESAKELYTEVGDSHGFATAVKGIADVHLGLGDYDRAEKTLGDAEELYKELGYGLGLANVKSSLGDLEFRREDFSSAMAHFKECEKIFRDLRAHHGLVNSLTDIIRCHLELSNKDAARGMAEEVKDLAKQNQNGYAWYTLIEAGFVNPKKEGHLP